MLFICVQDLNLAVEFKKTLCHAGERTKGQEASKVISRGPYSTQHYDTSHSDFEDSQNPARASRCTSESAMAELGSLKVCHMP